MVFEFSSQCEHFAPAGPATTQHAAEDPVGGVKSAATIASWQKRAHFSPEVEWVSEMIQEDAKRCLELHEKINRLAVKIAEVVTESKIGKILRSIPGFGEVCTSELAGEIGTVERFRTEGSLSLYLGMCMLDNSSGSYQGTKAPKHVNTRSKAAMMIAVDSASKVCAGVSKILRKETQRGKEAQPSDSISRTTPLSDHLQDAQARTPVRDSP